MDIPEYDAQSSHYDERAGYGDDRAVAIARGVLSFAAEPEQVRLLEIGCGTGEIGQYIAPNVADYTGLDRSGGMLAEFHTRLNTELPGCHLVQADGNALWPVADGSVDILFSSRALHLLDLDHVMAEIARIAGPQGGLCLIGREMRDPDGVAETMRSKMREILARHGYEGRSGKRNLAQFAERCTEMGGEALEAVTVATWEANEKPLDSLTSWRSKSGLAGLDLPDEVRLAVLDELQEWAEQHYGSLTEQRQSNRYYQLSGFQFPTQEPSKP